MTSLSDVWLPSFSRSSGSIRMKVMRFSKRLGATNQAVQLQIPDDHSPLSFCEFNILYRAYCLLLCIAVVGSFPHL